jgi:hypothetical protein
MYRMFARAGVAAGVACVTTFSATTASAHGFAGPRFFPATVATEDPFAADELALPTMSWFKEDGVNTTAYSLEYSKRITSNFALSFGGTYLRLAPEGEPKAYGFENIEIGAKYQLAVDPVRETIFSIGVEAELGGTGTEHIGAQGFSVITPALFFGKGFGNLFDATSFMRAFAITGSIGLAIPTEAHTVDEFGEVEENPNAIALGLALEYSLPYLQSQVRNVGLGAPFDRLVLVTELNLNTPFDRGGGKTTGTINPGLLWAGQSIQVSAQAIIPWNQASGHTVGFLAELHFYLDDIFPTSLGRPIFGP